MWAAAPANWRLGSRNMNNSNVFKGNPTNSPVPIANTITNTPAGVTGSGAVDGSIAYRQLRATDNPYDPRLDRPTGEVTVRDLVPVGDNDAQHSRSRQDAGALLLATRRGARGRCGRGGHAGTSTTDEADGRSDVHLSRRDASSP